MKIRDYTLHISNFVEPALPATNLSYIVKPRPHLAITVVHMLDAQTLNVDERQPFFDEKINRYTDGTRNGKLDHNVILGRFCRPHSSAKVSAALLFLVATVFGISASQRYHQPPTNVLQTLGSFNAPSQPRLHGPHETDDKTAARLIHPVSSQDSAAAAADVSSRETASENMTLQQYFASTRSGDKTTSIGSPAGARGGENPRAPSSLMQYAEDAPAIESFAKASPSATPTTSATTSENSSSGLSSTSIILTIAAGVAGLLLLACIVCAIIR